MIKSSYKVATVWGIPIQFHISHLFLILIISSQISPSILRNAGWIWHMGTGLILSFLFFTSIALHELGHSFVAIKKGCKVRSITLGIWGGVASMENMPTKPRDELLMALAGPMVSLGLGALFVGIAIALSPFRFFVFWYMSEICLWIGGINIVLAIFNIIPAFPMDGGRVLRAMLTPKQGRVKATYIASRIGKALALILGFYGLSQYFGQKDSLGILKVIIATLIYSMAEKEYQMVRMQDAAQFFTFGDEPDDSEVSDDRAEISPPPYDDGPGTTSNLKPL